MTWFFTHNALCYLHFHIKEGHGKIIVEADTENLIIKDEVKLIYK